MDRSAGNMPGTGLRGMRCFFGNCGCLRCRLPPLRGSLDAHRALLWANRGVHNLSYRIDDPTPISSRLSSIRGRFSEEAVLVMGLLVAHARVGCGGR